MSREKGLLCTLGLLLRRQKSDPNKSTSKGEERRQTKNGEVGKLLCTYLT